MSQCTPHIWLYFDRCEDLGLEEITPGTNYFDVECGSQTPVAVIAGTFALVALVLAGAGALGILIKKKHKKGPPSGKFHINSSIVFIWLSNCFFF